MVLALVGVAAAVVVGVGLVAAFQILGRLE